MSNNDQSFYTAGVSPLCRLQVVYRSVSPSQIPYKSLWSSFWHGHWSPYRLWRNSATGDSFLQD